MRSPQKTPALQNGIRLNRAIAARGLCSRRKADTLILSGKVLVNGVPENNPARRVAIEDAIAVNGKELHPEQPMRHILLYKPVGIVCTVHDPEGRPTVMDFLPSYLRGTRLYPAGRLDFFSEGLLILTNDGDLAQRLTHPRHHLPKIYEVLVRGAMRPFMLEDMRQGMRLPDGVDLLPVEVEARKSGNGNTLLRLTLRQGKNRQIRRMCEALGVTILRLVRVAQGPISLGNLKPGQTRELSPAEVAALKEKVRIA